GFDVRIPPMPIPPLPVERIEPPASESALQAFEPRDPNILRMLDESGDVRKLEDIEAEAIRFALAHYRGQMSKMARKMVFGRTTLHRKMKEMGVEPDETAGDADDAAA